MPSSFNLNFGGANLFAGMAGDAEEMPPGTPFRLLVVGNFRGESSSGPAWSDRKPVLVDRDDFDDKLAKIMPTITVASPAAQGGQVSLTFRSLDDFEPDRLVERVAVFEELLALQKRLGKPATFADAVAQINAWSNAPKPAASAESHKPVSVADVLNEIMGDAASAVSSPQAVSREASDWDRFLKDIAKPNLVEKTDPRQADYEAVVEEALGAQMRMLLHDPKFQSLETAWRSLFLLTKRLPTDEMLKIYFWDASRADLERDLGADDPRDSVYFREVVKKTVGTQDGLPWAAIVLLDTFGETVGDLELLAKMLLLSARAKTPLLVGGSPKLVGSPSLFTDPDPREWQANAALAGAWSMLRSLDEAAFLGVSLPRVLLRLPYGREASRTERFAFEEMPAQPDHAQYLWGPGSVFAGLLLAEGFVNAGWGMKPDDERQISGLPVHIFDDDGERAMKPCAEVALLESGFHRLIEAGLMVFLSLRDRDGVQLARFQSAAQEPTSLAGRWGG